MSRQEEFYEDPHQAFETDESDETTYFLKEFVFDVVKVPNPTILLVGKRFAGKSTASVSIAAHFPIPRWAAWCGTKDTQDYWSEKFESSASVWGPDEVGKAALHRVIKDQQKRVTKYKKHLKIPFPNEEMLGMIFDDVTSKRAFRKGEILEDLFSNGRHYKTVIIISCQYIKQLPPAVRTNTDYLFMLHNSKRTIKLLYEEYVENPEEFSMFLSLIRKVTSQVDKHGNDLYNSLVFDNVVKTYDLDKMFKVYRAPEGFDPDTTLLGSPEWRAHNKVHHIDLEAVEQAKEIRKKKRLQRLNAYYRRQMIKRNQSGGLHQFDGADLDVDYYSESDDSSSGEEEFDTVKLNHKRGKPVNIRMSNIRKTAEESGHTNFSQSSKDTGSSQSSYGKQPNFSNMTSNAAYANRQKPQPVNDAHTNQSQAYSQSQTYSQRQDYAPDPYGRQSQAYGLNNRSYSQRQDYAPDPYGRQSLDNGMNSRDNSQAYSQRQDYAPDPYGRKSQAYGMNSRANSQAYGQMDMFDNQRQSYAPDPYDRQRHQHLQSKSYGQHQSYETDSYGRQPYGRQPEQGPYKVRHNPSLGSWYEQQSHLNSNLY